LATGLIRRICRSERDIHYQSPFEGAEFDLLRGFVPFQGMDRG
jgi:hypothetical protein